MPTQRTDSLIAGESDARGAVGTGFDTSVLRRERELSARWKPDWHNQRRVDPPATVGARVSASRSLGLATIALSVEEIDVVIDRLDGTNACANPIVCDVLAILAGARAQAGGMR